MDHAKQPFASFPEGGDVEQPGVAQTRQGGGTWLTGDRTEGSLFDKVFGPLLLGHQYTCFVQNVTPRYVESFPGGVDGGGRPLLSPN